MQIPVYVYRPDLTYSQDHVCAHLLDLTYSQDHVCAHLLDLTYSQKTLHNTNFHVTSTIQLGTPLIKTVDNMLGKSKEIVYQSQA
jgi:hypothetical protein